MSYQLICYSKCSTCQKARRWLVTNGIPFTEREIKTENPSAPELDAWRRISGLALKRFFNTSGLLYKSLALKEKLPAMSDAEQLTLLATDGMLVRRPILVGEGIVLVGFREEEWKQALSGED